MMYASSRNLLSPAPQGHEGCCAADGDAMGRRGELTFAPVQAAALMLALLLSLTSVASAWAATPSTAPHTGMEGGMRHSYGPEGEGSKDKRIPTGGSVVDAYGNPIMPNEEMEEAPRQRPRPGAYGVRPTPPPSRPLPDLPADSQGPGWKFK